MYRNMITDINICEGDHMYKKLYKDIIDKVKLENRSKDDGLYYERHHILPDFLFQNRKRTGPKGHLDGNSDSPDNLVLLTFQEHLMCHYYLYEIYKDTRYGYSSGTALQFFFIKAIGNHSRQKNLSNIDAKFLNEMAHLRQLGIKSISNARKGKMPVVDAVTREKKGSVSITHPRVISGEWIHHSKGILRPNDHRDNNGKKNPNYKCMTPERKLRIYKCIETSIIDDNHFSKNMFVNNLKKEFIEFKKISYKWIENNFGKIDNLIKSYNIDTNNNILYNPYYRTKAQRSLAKIHNQNYCWITNGIQNIRLLKSDTDNYISQHIDYKKGRIHVKN